MTGRYRILFIPLLWAMLCMVGCGYDEETPAELDHDPGAPVGNPVIVGDDEDSPQETWGLWLGMWGESGFSFEEVPTSGTLAPQTAFTADGTLAIVSTRKTQITDETGDIFEQILYLTRLTPDGKWRAPLELARYGWSSQNTALLTDEDGRIHVLYSRDGAPTHLVVKEDQVTSYAMPAGPSAPSWFTIAASPLGLIHTVFGEWSLSHQVLVGDTWHVVQTFPDGSYPDLAFTPGPKTEARLVFLRYKGVGDACRVLHYVWDGFQWTGEAVPSEADFYPVPHLIVDSTGRSHILVPSSDGLMYLVQDNTVPYGWREEIVAGQNRAMGQEHADLAIADNVPVVAYRDAATARGFTGFREDGQWTTGELHGFTGGFIGLNLAVDDEATPYLVFAASRLDD